MKYICFISTKFHFYNYHSMEDFESLKQVRVKLVKVIIPNKEWSWCQCSWFHSQPSPKDILLHCPFHYGGWKNDYTRLLGMTLQIFYCVDTSFIWQVASLYGQLPSRHIFFPEQHDTSGNPWKIWHYSNSWKNRKEETVNRKPRRQLFLLRAEIENESKWFNSEYFLGFRCFIKFE